MAPPLLKPNKSNFLYQVWSKHGLLGAMLVSYLHNPSVDNGVIVERTVDSEMVRRLTWLHDRPQAPMEQRLAARDVHYAFAQHWTASMNRCDGAFARRSPRPVHAVRVLLAHLSDCEDVDCVSTFENIVNQCLDLGYRGMPWLHSFTRCFGIICSPGLSPLNGSGRRPSTAEVEDLVGVTTEAVQVLIGNANRERLV